MSDAQAVSDGEFAARFEAARQACFTGHEAGCSYGGMSPAYGYWLAAEGCPLDHGDACAVCGGEATAAFGDWHAEGGDLLIWRVMLCGECRDRELERSTGKWRAPSGG